jgi:hypothetical protein
MQQQLELMCRTAIETETTFSAMKERVSVPQQENECHPIA